jgi:hypothetical protein
MAPLENKVKSKESKRDSMRQLLVEEEEKVSGTLSSFKAMVKSVKELVDQIKDFVRINMFLFRLPYVNKSAQDIYCILTLASCCHSPSFSGSANEHR